MPNALVRSRSTSTLRRLSWVVATAVFVAGCTTTPPVAAPAVQPLAEYMQQAGQAVTEGNKERARELYRTAAKTYPTHKEPWLKLAEDYFEAGNYGQAILAAQEVLQRDPADSLASSVLAVSGLRVSASALATLRQQQQTLNGGTRTEAESLAVVLRDALGEPVLVPRPATAQTTAAALAVKPKPGPRPVAAAASAASAPKPAPAPTKPATPDNPFNVLKK
jgi:Flp pilus assembly protein TadD